MVGSFVVRVSGEKLNEGSVFVAMLTDKVDICRRKIGIRQDELTQRYFG